MAKSPLHKVTDAAHWDGEDVFSRLCIVAHAAFLSEGFVPCAGEHDAYASPLSLSRRYSVPQLVHRDGADAVVLCLSRRGRRRGGCGWGKIALEAYVATAGGEHRAARRERLTLDSVTAVLSRGIDDVARTIRAAPDDASAKGAWLWNLLADGDGLCRGLFLYLCRRSGVPLPSFEWLTDDVQMMILCRLDDAVDVARVACASKEARCLVAGNDAELWKAKYEAEIIKGCGTASDVHRTMLHRTMPQFLSDEDMLASALSWKERYAVARWQLMAMAGWRTLVMAGWGTIGQLSQPVPGWTPRVSCPKIRARIQTIVRVCQRLHREESERRELILRTAVRDTARRKGRGWSWGSDNGDRRAVKVVQSKWHSLVDANGSDGEDN